MSGQQTHHHYFVDEAGDLTLFNRLGRIIVGTEGVSRFFMVGVMQTGDPERLREELRQLRKELLQDKYLSSIPSMRPESGKTSIAFHAKDDCAEVRREVYRLLSKQDIKMQVAVRRKEILATDLRARYRLGIRWKPDNIYDDLIKRLFRNLLHKADRNVITVARRGKTDRLEALTDAITRAKRNFERQFGLPSDKPTGIFVDVPSNVEALQAADYCLWSLQRLFEKGEDRYFDYMRDHFRLVMDLDDTRRKPYGEWYSDSNILASGKIKMPTIG